MHVGGMKGWSDDGTGLQVWTEEPSYPSFPSQTGPGQTIDWTGIVKTAADAWGKITVANTQADIAKMQMQNPYARYPYYGASGGAYGTVNPYGSSLPSIGYPSGGALGPLPWSNAAGAGAFGMGGTSLLILAAAGVAAFMILRR